MNFTLRNTGGFRRWGLALTLAASCLQPLLHAAPWTHGPPADPAYFPIAVWLQNPSNAERFKAAGFNLYVGLWRGPTESQLSALKKADMPIICSQNALALERKDDPIIVGWMHNDEPDNAQSLGPGRGYGPPVLPETIVADYRRMQIADPTRPILLNLGQGVAWDNWIGRGVRRRHPEDYEEYVKGCDIASFDIYPAVHTSPEVAGKLEFVARGVERLIRWTEKPQSVWNCIECTRISNPEVKPTPDQVRAEVWMALIHGSRGLIYFVHQFKPTFREAALLDDPEMLEAVTRINHRVHALAPVLHSSEPGIPDPHSSVTTLTRRYGGATFLFSVNMRAEPTRASFDLKNASTAGIVEVLDEDRTLAVQEGAFADSFKPYEVHLYKVAD